MNSEVIDSWQARLFARMECERVAKELVAQLELCDNANELYNLLHLREFDKWEYVANDIYVNGEKQKRDGVCKMFIIWNNYDKQRRMRTEIDTERGIVRVLSTTYAGTDCIRGVSGAVRRVLGGL